MAGSITWRTYECDDGTRYSLKIAKHLANAVIVATSGVSGKCCLERGQNYPELPRGFQPRYVQAYPFYPVSGSYGRGTKKIIVGNPVPYGYLLGSPRPYIDFGDNNVAGWVARYWQIKYVCGEQFVKISPTDAWQP